MLLGWPGWCPAELLPLGAADTSEVQQGGKQLVKSLKLISFGKELGLANPHTKPLTSWLVGSEELAAAPLMMCLVPPLQVTIGMSLLSGDPCFKT